MMLETFGDEYAAYMARTKLLSTRNLVITCRLTFALSRHRSAARASRVLVTINAVLGW